MSLQHIKSGPRMSQAVIHNGVAYLSGQVATGAGGESVTKQTEDILAQTDALLAEVGTDKSKVLTATIWLCSMDDFDEMNAVWDAWVAPGATPARACVESPRLARPQFDVEIRVQAAID